MSDKILVVEDEENMRFLITETLTNKGYEVIESICAEVALEKIKTFNPHLALMDIRLPGISGLEAISKAKELDPLLPIVIITAFGSREVALEAIKLGAYDYFTKPFKLVEMEVVVDRAIEKTRLQRKLRELQGKLDENCRFGNIIGQSKKMHEVLSMIKKVARTDASVLVLGESGTGKELIADALHRHSRRKEEPFVKINCAAIPENLLESELFGHENGAFTGAIDKKRGKFELAHQGTIFLDEVGDMSFSAQSKLLRLLEQKELQRVGGIKTLKIDVRVISATNHDLSHLMKEKRFREDLFFRLNTFPVHIPPLRERKEDIPLLIDHFIHECNLRLGLEIIGVSNDAMELLLKYHWPGNVRELRNVIERGVTLAEGQLLTPDVIAFSFEMKDKKSLFQPPDVHSSLRETVEEVEKNLILNALQKTGGIQVEASKILGITEKNLWKKIKKHKINVKALKQM